jgi:hypothetical protein
MEWIKEKKKEAKEYRASELKRVEKCNPDFGFVLKIGSDAGMTKYLSITIDEYNKIVKLLTK